jgi:hypothetical protein
LKYVVPLMVPMLISTVEVRSLVRCRDRKLSDLSYTNSDQGYIILFQLTFKDGNAIWWAASTDEIVYIPEVVNSRWRYILQCRCRESTHEYPMVIAVNTTNKAEISSMKTKTDVGIYLTNLI